MRHVLIIEDNAMIAMSIESALRDTGATSFDFATTEDEAVASAFARRPDVILSDVTLASGTGPSAVQTIFDGIGRVPVLFVTGTPDDCAAAARWDRSSPNRSMRRGCVRPFAPHCRDESG